MIEDLGLDIRLQFLDEAIESLRPLDSQLRSIQGQFIDSPGLQSALRALHSIKAGAEMLGFSGLSELAHDFETLLVKLTYQLEHQVIQPDLELQFLLLAGLESFREVVGQARHQIGLGSRLDFAGQTERLTTGVYAIFDQLQHRIGDPPGSEPADLAEATARIEATAPIDSTEIGTQLFATEVEQRLQQLETLIAEATPAELKQGLSTLTQTLGDLGQILQMDHFSQLCATIAQDLDSSTGDIRPLAQQALQAWRRSQTIILTRSSEPLPTGLESVISAPAAVPPIPVDCTLRVPLAPLRRCQQLTTGLTQRQQDLESALNDLHYLTDWLQQQIYDLTPPDDRSLGAEPTAVPAVPEIQATVNQVVLWLESADHLTQDLHHISQQLQTHLTELRMRPFSDLLHPWPQALQSLCHRYQKEVQLKIDGADIWINRELLDQLDDPLNHLFRNAFDHGIELPATRIAQGKSRQGVIAVRIDLDPNYLQIQIKDDGRGLDLTCLRQRAEARGIQLPSNASDQTLASLIFEPGLSTKSEVSVLSGRGIGMEIVRDLINQLGGHITIATTSGQGTTFTLSIPYSAAEAGE